MKTAISLFSTTIFLLFAATCNSPKTTTSNDPSPKNTMEVTGTIQEQGMTSYQYGTHTLTTTDTFYALKSEVVDLNNYVDQKVTLIAEKVAGYPVDGGPTYLRVLEVKDKE